MAWVATVIPQPCFHTCAGSDVHTVASVQSAVLPLHIFLIVLTNLFLKSKFNADHLSLARGKKALRADWATPETFNTQNEDQTPSHRIATLNPACLTGFSSINQTERRHCLIFVMAQHITQTSYETGHS